MLKQTTNVVNNLKEHVANFKKQIDALELEIVELETLSDIEMPCYRCGRESTHFCNGKYCDAHDPNTQWCQFCHVGRKPINGTTYSNAACYQDSCW